MISALIETPEPFVLTVGFSELELASVLFDQRLNPVGVLGGLMDPSSATSDASGLVESFGEFGVPLLGVISAERLEQMILDPPERGKIDRAWLGISLQALTPDIAGFLDIEAPGEGGLRVGIEVIEEENPPAVDDSWLCNPDHFGDGDCDCGCGIPDSDCSGSGCTTDAASYAAGRARSGPS